MSKEYIEEHHSGLYVTGTRVSLDTLFHLYRQGAAPESIRRQLPTLQLEEIYGAITYYLAHQAEVDRYLEEGAAERKRQAEAARSDDPEFYSRLDVRTGATR